MKYVIAISDPLAYQILSTVLIKSVTRLLAIGLDFEKELVLYEDGYSVAINPIFGEQDTFSVVIADVHNKSVILFCGKVSPVGCMEPIYTPHDSIINTSAETKNCLTELVNFENRIFPIIDNYIEELMIANKASIE